MLFTPQKWLKFFKSTSKDEWLFASALKKGTRLLKIEPAEEKIVFLTFFYGFCIGILQNILFSVPLAMFLAHYNSSLLTLTYIGGGITSFIVGIGFTYLERKVSFFKLLALPTLFFSFLLLLFWGALFVVQEDWIYIVLQVWAVVIGSLNVSLVSLLFNQLFTLQQGKRLYGLIAGGVALGGIMIGFSLDFLVHHIGPNQIILLASCISFLGLYTQNKIKKNSGTRFLEKEESSSTVVSLKSFKDKKYMFSVFSITILVCFIFYTFDLLFNTEVQNHYKSEDAMASFYGIVFAIYDIGGLCAGFFLSSWLLSRLGLIASLLMWPICLTLFLSLAVFTHMVPPLMAIFFPVLIITSVLETVLREVITQESILLLFQPLRAAQRGWAQLKNEMLVGPLSMTLIGGILWWISENLGVQISLTAVIVVSLGLFTIAFTFLVIKKGYIKLLNESLTKRGIINPTFTKLSKESLGALTTHLKSAFPEEVIFTLQTIEGIDGQEFEKRVIEAVEHPLVEVRSFALNKIEEHRIKSAEEKTKNCCLTEKNPQVLGNALRALGSIAALEQFSWFPSYIESPNIEIASNAFIAAIKYGADAICREATQKLIIKAQSIHEADRLCAAAVLQSIEREDLLCVLITDSNEEVRIAACKAIRSTKDPSIFSALIDNLALPHVHDAAFYALTQLGSPCIEYCLERFSTFSLSTQLQVIKLLGYMKQEKIVPFLEGLFTFPKRVLLEEIVLALHKQGYEARDAQIKKLEDLLERENQGILFLKEIKNQSAGLLLSFLSREIEITQKCCFYMLSFIYPQSSILKAYHGLEVEDEDMNSNATEILFQTLEKTDVKSLLPQLVYDPYALDSFLSTSVPEATEEAIRKILTYSSDCYLPSLLPTAIYTIGILKLHSLKTLVQDQDKTTDPLLQEMVPIVLSQL